MFCKNCGKEIEDGSEFCPYCGTKQEGMNDQKKEIIQPKKSKKKLIIKMAAGCICIIAIIIAVVLMKNGSNTTTVFHEHTWAEATCTEPKTCSECGETEGEALGHTVEVGTCSRCNKIVNIAVIEDIFDSYDTIYDYNERIVDAFNNASYYEDNASVYYLAISQADVWLAYMEDHLQATINSCGNYKELSQLKSDVQTAIDTMPSACSSNDVDMMNAWIDQYNVFINYMQDYYDDIDHLIDDYNSASGSAAM